MITGTNPCYPNVFEEGMDPNSNSSSSTHPSSFLYNLSLLKDKVHQIQSLASIFISPDQPHESTAIAIPTMGTLIQEIIVTASSMMFACQQMSINPSQSTTTATATASQTYQDTWYADHQQSYHYNQSNEVLSLPQVPPLKTERERDKERERETSPAKSYDIIEMEASDLLAKFTHYCQVCGKGFKRDANLRMHMRAHGDEYKSNSALMKSTSGGETQAPPRKYSCPHEGCRWNKKHARFQPLKSMICVKNHYKRSHCPKMYVCKRCNRKHFSVLSDLRTHEKHCGDLKWQCSCGTTFSRKDKLMGHVALFVGHAPVAAAVAAGRSNGVEVIENG